MARKRDTEHVVVDLETGNWTCLHCGERRPAPKGFLLVRVYCTKLKGFTLLHQDCRPITEEKP